jgi:ATP-dependent protease ClpP protease subunit
MSRDVSRETKRDVPGLALRPRAEASAPAELMAYGRIGGGGWFDEGITGADVANLLREAGPGPLNVRINSGGGDVFDGVAIHSLLARHPGTVTAYIDGLAASAASFIMLAGDRIVAARNSFVMIHDAMTMAYGNGDTLRDSADLLDKVSENIADMYAERAGEDTAYWRNLMTVNGEDGTWYTGQEALDAGLVDEITVAAPDEDATVANRLAGWRNVLPSAIANKIDFPAGPVDKPVDKTTAPEWDAVAFRDLLRGAML